MRGNGLFHPNFYYKPRPTVESAQLTLVEVWKPTGTFSGWEPGLGTTNPTYVRVWRGYARVQPNKDWRARPRNAALDFDATHAIRVQVGIGKNLVGATYGGDGKVLTYGPDVEFAKDYRVNVVDTFVEGAQWLEGDEYYVREAKTSANLWTYNLLCDTSTKTTSPDDPTPVIGFGNGGYGENTYGA